MIRRRTVLILGAGASEPYGFPVGSDLFAQICNGELPIHVRRLFSDLPEVNEFRRALSRSGLTSVDAFLERRTDLMDLGKRLIACALIPFETEEALFRTPIEGPGQRWYRYLFGALNAPPTDFGDNNLYVITFNYDRSLEHFIVNALMQCYSLSAADAFEELDRIPIVHVHGTLGEYGSGGRLYSPELESEAVVRAVRSIKIVHEAVDSDIEFEQAHRFLSQAEQVVFLGFGYYSKNIERLKLDVIPQHARLDCSSFGLTELEKTIARKVIGRTAYFDKDNRGALDFLRHTINLTRQPHP